MQQYDHWSNPIPTLFFFCIGLVVVLFGRFNLTNTYRQPLTIVRKDLIYYFKIICVKGVIFYPYLTYIPNTDKINVYMAKKKDLVKRLHTLYLYTVKFHGFISPLLNVSKQFNLINDLCFVFFFFVAYSFASVLLTKKKRVSFSSLANYAI